MIFFITASTFQKCFWSLTYMQQHYVLCSSYSTFQARFALGGLVTRQVWCALVGWVCLEEMEQHPGEGTRSLNGENNSKGKRTIKLFHSFLLCYFIVFFLFSRRCSTCHLVHETTLTFYHIFTLLFLLRGRFCWCHRCHSIHCNTKLQQRFFLSLYD